MYLSNLIGKQIYSWKGEAVGYSRCPCFTHNFKKITALLCADLEEESFFLPLSENVYKNEKLILPRRGAKKNTGTAYAPLSKPIFRTDGTFLGFATDMVLDNFKVTALKTGEMLIPFNDVVALGDCILVRSPMRVRFGAGNQKTNDAEIAKNSVPLALGRNLNGDVTDAEGKIMFAKGATVTNKMITSALSKNRLIALTAMTLPFQSE